METVLLVAVPSKQHRSKDRILPGRDDVYIIPMSSCEEGRVLKETDLGMYYSNTHIEACLILKPPSEGSLVPPSEGSVRLQVTSAYDDCGGMINVRMTEVAADERLSDELDTSVFPPLVKSCTATLAQGPTVDAVALHRIIENEKAAAAKRHWLENTARFKPAEMEYGVEGINNLLLHAYTIAFVYASRKGANEVCKAGGIAAIKNEQKGTYALKLSLRSPAQLNWQINAAGPFKRNVASLMAMPVDDVQAVIILGVPAGAVEAAVRLDAATFTIEEQTDNLKLLVADDRGQPMYSGAHIVKIYDVEPAALVEARRELQEFQGAAAASDAEAELMSKVQQVKLELGIP